ncbi:MAG: Sensor histidine kinase [Devosia sp.]|nr:Sensor histidine kinase [Devosia sp.]
MAQRRGSIAARLFMLSTAWLVVSLVATAFLLTELYAGALDNRLGETLDLQLESLVARTLEAGNPQSSDVELTDPRFDRPKSGWYWAIKDSDGALLNLSGSIVGSEMPAITLPFNANNTRTDVARDAFGTEMRMVERQIRIGDRELHIIISGNLDEIRVEAGSFRGQTLTVLGFIGIMLAIMSAITARIALRPLGQLRAAVESVREGETDKVAGNFPYEVAPLAEEVNALLRSNAGIIERAKSQVGNLAHGLKTPLAVLRNEANGRQTVVASVVTTETDKMAAIVTNYLDQARLAARTRIVGKKADANLAVKRLVRVMGKVHPSREVSLVEPVPATLPWFRGEESDLEEMVGNLLDNACKWAKASVEVTLGEDAWAGSRALVIRIEDDGKGLTEDEAKAVLKRGVRLDEKTPGSGLGLDIVKELVDVYGGGFVLGRSRLGGLRAELLLPAARPTPRLPVRQAAA